MKLLESGKHCAGSLVNTLFNPHQREYGERKKMTPTHSQQQLPEEVKAKVAEFKLWLQEYASDLGNEQFIDEYHAFGDELITYFTEMAVSSHQAIAAARSEERAEWIEKLQKRELLEASQLNITPTDGKKESNE